MNRRPVPSWALVISTGLSRPLGDRRELDRRRPGGARARPRRPRAAADRAAPPRGRAAGRASSAEASAAPATAERRERGAKAVGLVTWSSCGGFGRGPARVRRTPKSCPNSSRASNRGRILAFRDHRFQPHLRRPEHDRAAARGAGEGARPGVRAAPSTTRPHGFLRPVDLDRARREHDGLVDTLDAPGRPTVHVLDAETDDPDLVYVFDPLLVADGGAIPLRPGQAEPGAASPRARGAGRRAPGIPTLGPDRGAGHARGRRHVLARARTCCASAGRCARTRPARGSWRRSSAATSRVFDVPYWKGPAELVHLLSVISPVADDVAVVFLPLLPAGLYELLADLGVRLVEVPEDEYPTLGCNVLAVRPGVVVVAEGNAGDPARPGGGRLRGPRDPARRGGRERLGRRHLPDAPGPARVSPGRGPPRRVRPPPPSTPPPSLEDLAALVRIPSVTGDEDAIAGAASPTGSRRSACGWRSSTPTPPRSARTRTGRARRWRARRCRSSSGGPGGPAGERLVLSGHVDVVPARRSRRPGPSTRGAREVRDGRLYGRGACDMKGGVAVDPGRRPRAAATPAPWTGSGGELLVAFVPSEEDGGQGTLAAIRAGATGDLCVITGAVEPRRRRRPRGRHHVPAHRPGPGGPREPPDRGRVGARQPGRRSSGPSRPTRRAATPPRPIR